MDKPRVPNEEWTDDEWIAVLRVIPLDADFSIGEQAVAEMRGSAKKQGPIQTRSEVNGSAFWHTVEESKMAIANDPTIYEVGWVARTGHRVYFVRQDDGKFKRMDTPPRPKGLR